MSAPSPERLACVAIHDVTPGTRDACERLLDLLGDCMSPSIPLAWLVVPRHHADSIAAAATSPRDPPPHYLRWLDERRRLGDELVLHGWTHHDDQPVRGLRERVARRLHTRGEGEFAALDGPEATRRLQCGLEWFTRHGWPVHGFVPPAWLAGPAARSALERSALRYYSTLHHLVGIPERTAWCIPVVSASTRSALRRLGSREWLRLADRILVERRAIRIALHPSDVDDPKLLRAWARALPRLLEGRRVLTKRALVDRLVQPIAPPNALTADATTTPSSTPASTSLG